MVLRFLAALAIAAPAHAVEPGWSLEAEAQALLPGQHVWGNDPADGALVLLVSLGDQRLYVYRDGLLIGAAAISSGKPGKATPPGEFAILQKRRWHRSNLYSNAPMPFMQRLTWDGIALHAGENPGHPASHGCIRLPERFARELFAMTGVGEAVSVVAYRLSPSLAFRIEGLNLAAEPVPALDYDLGALTAVTE